MKKIILLLCLSFFILSCEKDSNQPSNSNEPIYSEEGVWQYDVWTYNGINMLTTYDAYLFVCESEWWATDIYDLQGNLTEFCSAGTYTLNSDKTEGTFTQEIIYDPNTDSWTNITPATSTVTINKLDDNNLA